MALASACACSSRASAAPLACSRTALASPSALIFTVSACFCACWRWYSTDSIFAFCTARVIDRLAERVSVLHVGQLEIGDLEPQYLDVAIQCCLDRFAQFAALLGDRLHIDLAHCCFQPVDGQCREAAFVVAIVRENIGD